MYQASDVPDAESHSEPIEESSFTDDPVRAYLREMGSVPLLTRQGELLLARKMDRGKLRMRKVISRSPLVQRLVLEFSELIRKGNAPLDRYVDLRPTGIEDGGAADRQRRSEMGALF